MKNSPPQPDSTVNTQNDCKTFTRETCWFPFRCVLTGTKIYFWFKFFLSFSYGGKTFDRCTDYASVNQRPYCLTTVWRILLKNMKLPVFLRTAHTRIATSISTMQTMAANGNIRPFTIHRKLEVWSRYSKIYSVNFQLFSGQKELMPS